ncbi:MAG TPA: lysylphosphatidylglycerol synthase transmembrane domain-containing protein [Gemmatimonadales bacterium]|nr:lysylphosphatidylglycerol synthase transmembrane domain-containing protein [Gemmatimonadales bacterium]
MATTSNPGRSRSRLWTSLVGLAISVGLIALIVRQVDLAEVQRHLTSARPLPLLVGVFLATVTFLLRTVRWRYLLRRPNGEPLPMGALWHATAMGFMANNMLPLRAGEIIRPFAVARLAGIRFTTALASIAVERIFDALTVVLLLTIALASPGLGADVVIGGVPVTRIAAIAAGASAVALVAGALVVARPLAAEAVVRRVVPSPRLADRLVALIEGIRQGLAALDSPRRLAPVVVWSLVHWIVNAASLWVFFAAFDIPVGFAGALLVQGLVVFGVSVPSTPGYIGPFEAAIVAGLALYGISQDQSFSYALAYHVTTFIPIVVLGLWSTVKTGFGLGGLRRARAE